MSSIEAFKEGQKANEYLACYDLEDYTIPALVRKLLKTTKRTQIRSVRCKRKDKLTDHLDDPNGVFTLERFEQMQNEAVITFTMLDFDQKEYTFKVSLHLRSQSFCSSRWPRRLHGCST